MPPMGQAGAQAVIWGWDGTDPQRLRAAAPADARSNPAMALDVNALLSAWDSVASTWDRVQGDGYGNLYAMLRSGATAFDAIAFDDDTISRNGLAVVASLRGKYDTGDHRVLDCQRPSIDNFSSSYDSLFVISQLYGFDGTYWDRLRTYGTGVLKVGRAEVGLSTGRLTDAGAVKASAGKLFWLTVQPSAAAWILALTNATAASGTVVWAAGDIPGGALHVVFDPPMEFSTGIYLETFTNLTSVTFGYI